VSPCDPYDMPILGQTDVLTKLEENALVLYTYGYPKSIGCVGLEICTRSLGQNVVWRLYKIN